MQKNSIVYYNYITNSNKLKNNNITANKYKIKPWISACLIKSIRTRDKVGKKILKIPNDLHFVNYYKKYKNKLCTFIRCAKN